MYLYVVFDQRFEPWGRHFINFNYYYIFRFVVVVVVVLFCFSPFFSFLSERRRGKYKIAPVPVKAEWRNRGGGLTTCLRLLISVFLAKTSLS